jgi:hypothetical protein
LSLDHSCATNGTIGRHSRDGLREEAGRGNLKLEVWSFGPWSG